MKYSISRFFTLSFAALLLSLVSGIGPIFAQTSEKLIMWSQHPIGSNNEKVTPKLELLRQIDGVQIDEIVVEGTPASIGDPFPASDDWLKNIFFRVRNVSNRRLITIQITLALPEMAHGSPDVVYCYGCSEPERKKGVKPDQVVELRMLEGGFYDWVKARAQRDGLSKVTKAEIHHMYVTLPTGPRWFSGCVKTSDIRNSCLTTAN
jgi:hypothetical protein